MPIVCQSGCGESFGGMGFALFPRSVGQARRTASWWQLGEPESDVPATVYHRIRYQQPPPKVRDIDVAVSVAGRREGGAGLEPPPVGPEEEYRSWAILAAQRAAEMVRLQKTPWVPLPSSRKTFSHGGSFSVRSYLHIPLIASLSAAPKTSKTAVVKE